MPTRKLTTVLLLATSILSFFLLSISSAPVSARHTHSPTATFIIRVDINSVAGSPDGSSWANAYPNLQDALAAAIWGPQNTTEIWVADGVYYPDVGGSYAADDPAATFQLKSGVDLYGGFEGLGGAEETSRTQRDWQANVTVLSGDLAQDDGVDTNGVVLDTSDIITPNSYHVLNSEEITNQVTLDGFFITAGYADGSLLDGAHVGGGMYNSQSTLSLANLTFSGNYASSNGGGMYNLPNTDPELSNVTFTHNWAGSFGGGLFNSNFSAPTLTHVSFVSNTASLGGGMYTNSDSPLLTNVAFIGNHTSSHGAGMYNNASDPTLINVLFSGNRAGGDGAGIYNNGSDPMLINVTFAGNHGAGTFSDGGGIFNNNSNPHIRNSIFWNNQDSSGLGTVTASMAGVFDYTPWISYTLIQGSNGSGSSWITDLGIDGGNNSDVNPAFVEPVDPALAPTEQGDTRLQLTSPAIDVGNNAYNPSLTDVGTQDRIVDGDGDTVSTIDLGAHENQSTAMCGLVAGNTYAFADQLGVRMAVVASTDLDCLVVKHTGASHPEATGNTEGTALRTGNYWHINGLTALGGSEALTFTLSLTLPHNLGTRHTDAKVCKYPHASAPDLWDCARTNSDPGFVWRDNITALSDWAVGDTVGPNATILTSFTGPQPLPYLIALIATILLVSLPTPLVENQHSPIHDS